MLQQCFVRGRILKFVKKSDLLHDDNFLDFALLPSVLFCCSLVLASHVALRHLIHPLQGESIQQSL